MIDKRDINIAYFLKKNPTKKFKLGGNYVLNR